MRGGADDHRVSPAALLPVVLVAVIVLALALFVRGSETGTIVVERVLISSTTTQNGRTTHPTPFTVNTITQSSAGGGLQAQLTSNTFSRRGFEDLLDGHRVELYDPLDHTIYATTLDAEQRAIEQQQSYPRGTHAVSRVVQINTHGIPSVAGKRSIFEQRLLAGLYRIAGRAEINGHPALRLVPSTANLLVPAGDLAAAERLTGVAYVSPRTYDPIELVVDTRLPRIGVRTVELWQTYRVLAATGMNERLLSMTARHPGARVVHSAAALLRATNSEIVTHTYVVRSSP